MPTRLNDIIDVKVYQDLTPVDTNERVELLASGIMESSPLLDTIATNAGDIGELPFWRDLDTTADPNISTDNPATMATPQKITQGSQVTRIAQLNMSFSMMDLSRELAMGPDGIQHIRNRFAAAWDRQLQRRLIASALGVMADNVANDNEDMVWDATGATVPEAQVFTRGNFVDAVMTLGDAFNDISAIAVHSMTYGRMVKSGDIIMRAPFEGSMQIPYYLTHAVIVDDSIPVDTGGG